MRLIDADALERWLEMNYANANPLDYITKATLAECLAKVKTSPTIDAAPVAHSSWCNPWPYRTGAICRKCEAHAARKLKYCPECGAKMDAKEGAEE